MNHWPREHSQGEMLAAEVGWRSGALGFCKQVGLGLIPAPPLTSGDSTYITGYLRSRSDVTFQALAKSRHIVGDQGNAAAVLTDKLMAPADPARPRSYT